MAMSDFVKKMMISRQLDFEKGRFELLGIRGIILPSFTFVSLLEGVYDVKGDEVFEILFETGRKHGRLGIEQIGKKNKVAKREFFSEVFESGNIMGLGKAEIKNFNPDTNHLRITVEDSPIDEKLMESEKFDEYRGPVNYFLKGVFYEMADQVMNAEIEIKQEKCEFLGDDVCEFIIKPKEDLES